MDFFNKIEKNYLLSLKTQLEEAGCTNRVFSSINWYYNAAERNKKIYYILTVFAICIPLVNFFIAKYFDDSWLSLTALFGSMSVALLNLFQCQKKWISYRSTLETLKGLTEKYLSSDNSYEYIEFIEKFEEIMASENKEWTQYVQKETKPDANTTNKT